MKINLRNYKRIDVEDAFRQAEMKGHGGKNHSIHGTVSIIASWVAILSMGWSQVHVDRRKELVENLQETRRKGIQAINEAIERLAKDGIYVKLGSDGTFRRRMDHR